MPAVFSFPLRILFGEGCRRDLTAELSRLGVLRPMVVTDPGVIAAGLLQEVMPNADPARVFDGVVSNPTEANVLDGLARYRENGCDGLLAVGGGSPIDVAKAIRLLDRHPGTLADYDLSKEGDSRITADMPPLVAVPTTSGTGSEAAREALIQLPQTGRKTILFSPHLLPSVALCDPELTWSLPPGLTAGTGMDAFTHGIESFLSTTYHPVCDGIALEGLKHVAKGLEAAVRDGQDRRARRELMVAALLGGISQHKGLGVIHSLSHALGAEGRVHHGTLSAILLPHALRFNLPSAEPLMAELASQLGVGRGLHGPSHLITLTELVLTRLPIPERLGQVPGLDRGRIPEYARLAEQDHCHRTNPRPCSIADFETLLDRAW